MSINKAELKVVLIQTFIIWLAPRAGKMTDVIGLPERARWSHHARSGLPAVSRKKNFPESHLIDPLLTKIVRSSCKFIDLDFASVHKHAEKELGQYPAILTSHLVNNQYIFIKTLDITVCPKQLNKKPT